MLCVRCKHPLPPRADRCLRCFALNPQNVEAPLPPDETEPDGKPAPKPVPRSGAKAAPKSGQRPASGAKPLPGAARKSAPALPRLSIDSDGPAPQPLSMSLESDPPAPLRLDFNSDPAPASDLGFGEPPALGLDQFGGANPEALRTSFSSAPRVGSRPELPALSETPAFQAQSDPPQAAFEEISAAEISSEEIEAMLAAKRAKKPRKGKSQPVVVLDPSEQPTEPPTAPPPPTEESEVDRLRAARDHAPPRKLESDDDVPIAPPVSLPSKPKLQLTPFLPEPEPVAPLPPPPPARTTPRARLTAWTFDASLLCTAVTGFVGLTAAVLGRPRLAPLGYQSPDSWADQLLFGRNLPLLWCLLLLTLGVAYSWLFAALDGRTPGMQLAGLRLRKLDGGLPGPALGLAHALLALPSLLGLFGFLSALFDPRCQTLHDKVLGLVVEPDE